MIVVVKLLLKSTVGDNCCTGRGEFHVQQAPTAQMLYTNQTIFGINANLSSSSKMAQMTH